MGLKIGVHQYRYTLDSAFFGLFEGTPIERGTLEATLELDKRSDMLLLQFHIKGKVEAACDRCTATINLPVEDSSLLIVKYGEAAGETEDEVVFISRDQSEFNVAKYLYEFSVLALPITNTYDCESEANPPCNFEVLKYLNQESNAQQSGNVWDALKGLNQ